MRIFHQRMSTLVEFFGWAACYVWRTPVYHVVPCLPFLPRFGRNQMEINFVPCAGYCRVFFFPRSYKSLIYRCCMFMLFKTTCNVLRKTADRPAIVLSIIGTCCAHSVCKFYLRDWRDPVSALVIKNYQLDRSILLW